MTLGELRELTQGLPDSLEVIVECQVAHGTVAPGWSNDVGVSVETRLDGTRVLVIDAGEVA